MKKLSFLILILLAFTLSSCKKDGEIEFKPDKINAEHTFINEDFISYIKLSTNLELENETIIPKYSMTAFMHITNGINRKIQYYQVDWLTSDNTYDTYYRNELDVSTPARFIGQQFLPFIKVSGNAIDTISAYYKYQSTVNNVLEIKEVKYKEDILKFNLEDFNETAIQNEILNFNVYKYEFNDDKYHLKFAINFESDNEPIHLDMQSWLKTNDGQVFPLMGLYNYATFSEDYLSISDEVVDGIVEIDEIYVKIVYTHNNQTKTITNVFAVNDLYPLESY